MGWGNAAWSASVASPTTSTPPPPHTRTPLSRSTGFNMPRAVIHRKHAARQHRETNKGEGAGGGWASVPVPACSELRINGRSDANFPRRHTPCRAGATRPPPTRGTQQLCKSGTSGCRRGDMRERGTAEHRRRLAGPASRARYSGAKQRSPPAPVSSPLSPAERTPRHTCAAAATINHTPRRGVGWGVHGTSGSRQVTGRVRLPARNSPHHHPNVHSARQRSRAAAAAPHAPAAL